MIAGLDIVFTFAGVLGLKTGYIPHAIGDFELPTFVLIQRNFDEIIKT